MGHRRQSPELQKMLARYRCNDRFPWCQRKLHFKALTIIVYINDGARLAGVQALASEVLQKRDQIKFLNVIVHGRHSMYVVTSRGRSVPADTIQTLRIV